MKTPYTRLAEALHAACVEVEEARKVAGHSGVFSQLESMDSQGALWTDRVGKHIALAIAAIPDAVLREWLMDPNVVGGDQIYRTLKAGSAHRAVGKDVAA